MSTPLYDGVDNRIINDDQTVSWLTPSGDVRTRLGLATLSDGFSALCALAAKMRPVSARVFGEDHVVTILYDVALAVCAVSDAPRAIAAGAPDDAFAESKQQLARDLRAISDRITGGAS